MKPKKEILERASKNGSIDRLNSLLSAAHLLRCEAANLVSEANDLMIENGLLLGELKKYSNDLDRIQDIYFNEFTSMIDTEKQKKDLFYDYEHFDKEFRKYAKLC